MFRHSAQDGHRVGPFLALLAASGDAPATPRHRDKPRPDDPATPDIPARVAGQASPARHTPR